MTDKQIIIDEIDVSGCEHHGGMINEYKQITNWCNVHQGTCEENPNCYYKQLKYLKKAFDYREETYITNLNNLANEAKFLREKLQAKEQECERLKKKLNPRLKNAHCAYFEGQTGLCKAKEFSKCNPVGCKLYTIDELSTIVDLQEQLKSKEQEYEELKTENNTYKSSIIANLDNNISKRYRELLEENDQLKQTLAEIKEIAEKGYDSSQITKLILDLILKKINEVEDEKNM